MSLRRFFANRLQEFYLFSLRRDFFHVHAISLLAGCNVLLRAGGVWVDSKGDFCVLGV